MIKTMPKVALGTWMINDKKVINDVVTTALKNGYKHIDTAQVYFNEEFIGETLSKLDVPREKYWITSKVWVANMKYHTYESVEKSLEKLQATYIDTMLLHSMTEENIIINAYKELIKARENGLIRTIGVSNHSIEMMEAIKKATGEYPKYNQIVSSVKHRMVKLEKFCKEKDITLMGYSTIRPYYNPNTFYPSSGLSDAEKVIIDETAAKYNSSPAKILLKWSMNHGYVQLPKSEKPARVIDNLSFTELELSKEEMTKLDSMNTFGDEEFKMTMKEWLKIKPTEKDFKIGLRISPESDKYFLTKR